MDKSSIGLSTTVNNLSLYKRTVESFPEIDKLFIVDGTQGLYGIKSITFLLRKLKKKNIKWLILCDEDVIFTNQQEVFKLIEYLDTSQYDVCGVRDGGMLSWRGKNPYLLNPFFTILNLEKIYQIYNEDEMLSQSKIGKNEFNDDLDSLEYNYNKDSAFEGYYCFFLWLRRKGFKFKFLEAESSLFPNDLETTSVYNHDNKLMLYHTWYARIYGKDNYHSNRIDNIIKKGNRIKAYTERNIVIFRSYNFVFKKKLNKIFRVIIREIKR